ncbi:2,3-diaminopropionate biosynthesis protein SbnA [Pseudomonas putida]|uniref:cysteine synthase n=1 Tax=Pseudomonas putida TaxID=303 RepID=A0A7W2QKM3_PSEPU|nr:2,3-diaminopropionate biosynthesis protein SbnA [Pseudomonas putida]MBA6118047.1 2,3-diaminopropionate biosynthesis protein SbnA [Pseudomonas putida]
MSLSSLCPVSSQSVEDLVHDHTFLHVCGIGADFHLKLECFNPAGSIKLKTARGMIDDLQARGLIKPESRLIESSSGNLGVALAMLCAARGLHFTCVVDPNSSRHSLKLMRIYGAEVIEVDRTDANGGFLGTRIALIHQLLAGDSRYLWLNQYENAANPEAHARTTAPAIAERFPHIDYLFVGAGTTGTLMGCTKYFQKHFPHTRIIAVDSVGSVTFGTPAGRRFVPGLGTSQRPPIFDPTGIHALEMVTETQTVAMARLLARDRGLLVGGSTATVVAAVHAWRERIEPGAVVVALSPDWGERYLDTLYDDAWVEQRFGRQVLEMTLDDLTTHPDRTTWLTPAPASRSVVPAPRHSAAFHVVDGQCIAHLLAEDPLACIEDVRRAYLAHESGCTVNPDSYFLRFPSQPANRIIALPASLDDEAPVTGIKWISSFPGNVQTGLQRASAVLLLNDPRTGYAYACLESSRISAMRTAASAVLGAYWANGRSRRANGLAIVGSGFIARNLMDLFIADGWSFEHIGVHDQHRDSVQAMLDHLCQQHSRQARGVTLDQALEADILVFATTASEPYVLDAALRPGQVVLNISLRDLGPAVIAQANNLFDDVEHCLKAGTSPQRAVEHYQDRSFLTGTLAQLMRGLVELDPQKPTIFSPFGLGVLDLALGQRLYRQALSRQMATAVPNFFFEPNRW